MSKTIKAIINFDQLTPDLLKAFTREQLRAIARKYEIPRGRNKKDTILNLLGYSYFKISKIKDQCKVKISITT